MLDLVSDLSEPLFLLSNVLYLSSESAPVGFVFRCIQLVDKIIYHAQRRTGSVEQQTAYREVIKR